MYEYEYTQYILDLCQDRLSTADHAKRSVAIDPLCLDNRLRDGDKVFT
jgi:hypothetical protein